MLYRDGKHLTLAEVFASINLTAYDLSIDTLDMHVSAPPPGPQSLLPDSVCHRRTPIHFIGSTNST